MSGRGSEFVQFMLWAECRHRQVQDGPERPAGAIGGCALALEEDPGAGCGGEYEACQRSDCPHLDREDVP